MPSVSLHETRPGEGFRVGALAVAATFLTYFCTYALRKPFTVGEYSGLSVFGLSYKTVLVLAQVLGYATAKFAGIKLISEMPASRRILALMVLTGAALAALILFAVVPSPWNCVLLFFNGFPLGLIWGIVFSFLEGRRNTELLGAALCTSFIVASGVVKSAGRWLMQDFGVSHFWMPALTGLLFVPPLLLAFWLLRRVPPPSARDVALRSQRVPLNAGARREFFRSLAPGIVLLIIVYVTVNAYRDFRDNFAVELWRELGYGETPWIFTVSEVPIAAAVILVIGSLMLIRSNLAALFANHFILFLGGALVAASTWWRDAGLLDGATWMILVGLGMYLAYIAFHTMVWERMIAVFRRPANVAFLMYLCDSFGYLGSVLVLISKEFGDRDRTWLEFFSGISYGAAIIVCVGAALSAAYFRRRTRAGLMP